MNIIFLGLCFGAIAIAQTSTLNPGTFFGFGTGYQISQGATAWIDYCKKTSESVYGCAAVDLGKTISTRAGIETIILKRGRLILTVKGEAGASTSKAGSGAAYGAGASAIYDVSAHTKVPGTYAVCSVSVLKQNVANVERETVVRIGVGKTF